MSKKQQHIVRLERDVDDNILPRDFFTVLVHRFLPVLSLIYISSIIGIAADKGDFVHYAFQDTAAYLKSALVVLWVSGPAIIWMFLRGNPMLCHVADLWYRILAILMVITISLIFLLFPEADIWGLRLYLVLSIPIFIVIYILFVKEWFPSEIAYPLNALGFCALFYGAIINLIY